MARNRPTPGSRSTPGQTHFAGGTNMRFFACPGPTSATLVTISSCGFTPSPNDTLVQAVAIQTNTAGVIQTVINLVSSGADVSTGGLIISGSTVDYSGYSVYGLILDQDA